jgi:hypothetical protein
MKLPHLVTLDIGLNSTLLVIRQQLKPDLNKMLRSSVLNFSSYKLNWKHFELEALLQIELEAL